MKYLSLFSGIEAASVAWHPLGWQPVAFSEIEPFPCAVLAQHYPAVPNFGDITEVTDKQIAALGHIDLVVGGTPCQNFSFAGNRKGLAGTQSALFHEFVRVFHAARSFCGARWLVWENVPGALSSNQGHDFACVVNALAGCNLTVPEEGWGTEGVALGEYGLLEWACLDAQWFGLAQRRKRLFVVFDTGQWADRPPILLERDRLRGDCPARRKTQQGNTTADLAGAVELSRFVPDTSLCLNAGAMGRRDFESETFVIHGSQDPIASTTVAHAMGRNQGQENVVCTLSERDRAGVHALGFHRNVAGISIEDAAYSLITVPNQASAQDSGVRRLTPRECERLQGFPDDYTRIAWRGKPAESCPDGPRYKALGNSMAVPVMRWIGEQIEAVTCECTRTNADSEQLLEKAA